MNETRETEGCTLKVAADADDQTFMFKKTECQVLKLKPKGLMMAPMPFHM